MIVVVSGTITAKCVLLEIKGPQLHATMHLSDTESWFIWDHLRSVTNSLSVWGSPAEGKKISPFHLNVSNMQ